MPISLRLNLADALSVALWVALYNMQFFRDVNIRILILLNQSEIMIECFVEIHDPDFQKYKSATLKARLKARQLNQA